VSETLRQKQSRFAHNASQLILHAIELGFEVTYGETLRKPAQAAVNAATGAGIVNSLHLIGLAIDINLFEDGRYLAESNDHLVLGVWWEALGPDHCWGGRFKDALGRPKADGNHYSISHEGRK
jgi:hypothetical protein